MTPLKLWVQFYTCRYKYLVFEPEFYTLYELKTSVLLNYHGESPSIEQPYNVEVSLPWDGTTIPINTESDLQALFYEFLVRRYDNIHMTMNPVLSPRDFDTIFVREIYRRDRIPVQGLASSVNQSVNQRRTSDSRTIPYEGGARSVSRSNPFPSIIEINSSSTGHVEDVGKDLAPINNNEMPINKPLVSVFKEKSNEVKEPLESPIQNAEQQGVNRNEQPVPSMDAWGNHEINHEEEDGGGIELVQSMIPEAEQQLELAVEGVAESVNSLDNAQDKELETEVNGAVVFPTESIDKEHDNEEDERVGDDNDDVSNSNNEEDILKAMHEDDEDLSTNSLGFHSNYYYNTSWGGDSSDQDYEMSDNLDSDSETFSSDLERSNNVYSGGDVFEGVHDLNAHFNSVNHCDEPYSITGENDSDEDFEDAASYHGDPNLPPPGHDSSDDEYQYLEKVF